MAQESTIHPRMLAIHDVLKILPISRQYLWRLSTTKKEADRIPSYKIGGKRFYKYDEIMFFLDNHKFDPKK